MFDIITSNRLCVDDQRQMAVLIHAQIQAARQLLYNLEGNLSRSEAKNDLLEDADTLLGRAADKLDCFVGIRDNRARKEGW